MNNEQTVTLDQLKSGNMKSVNPADLLPKRPVESTSIENEALGDLALIMRKENAETRKLAEAMIADMNKAKAAGVKPRFRDDMLATEGMQPINFNFEGKEAIDYYADTDEDTKNAKPSEYMVDLEGTTSISNYTKSPEVFDRSGTRLGAGTNGPRSIIKDNAEAVGRVIDESQYINKPNESTNEQATSNTSDNSDDSVDVTVDPDEMDDENELKKLLGEDYVESFPTTSPQINEQSLVRQDVVLEKEPIEDRSNEVMENLENIPQEVVTTSEVKPEVVQEVPKGEQHVNIVQQPVKQEVKPEVVQEEAQQPEPEYTEDDTEEVQSDEYYDGDEETELMTDERKEQILQVVRSRIMDKIRPVKFDLQSFTVASPVKVLNILTGENKALSIDTADWYLPSTGVNITMRKFDGAELVSLNGSSAKSVRNNNLDALRLIHDHIVNPKKPDFETWIRTVRMEDMDHLYFAIMQATFKDANFVPYFCTNPKCKDVDVPNKSFDDMIYFYDEKVKADFYERIQRGTYNYTVDAVEVERVPISKDYCIDIKMPTLYDILVEPTYLSKEYRIKHSEKITMIGYINEIYRIDYTNNALIPIDYTLNTEDDVKILKNKYRLYIQLLDSLQSDSYSYLTSIINKLTRDKAICEFLVPGHKCEVCGKEIEPVRKEALDLLFTRHQLAALANI